MPRINLIEKELSENFMKAVIHIIIELTVFFAGATLLIMSLGWQLGLGITLMAIYVKAKE
jgi:hypothetical protein